MNEEFKHLWAQLGILNQQNYNFVLQKFGNLEEAWRKITPAFLKSLKLRTDTIKNVFEIRKRISFEQIMDQKHKFNVKLYCFDDEDYPESLKESKTAPPFLFVRGKLPSFHKSISIVGTRTHSDYGKHVTQRFTADLVREGFVIVSGLALGIDSIAHKTTLENGGTTVAVLGCGVDRIYPSMNHRLAMNILANGGAVISAYPLGTRAFPYHFPERNQIVAGLTLGTLFIEGGIKSGARSTMKSAIDNNRGVFAVPSEINNYNLSGTNEVIRNSAAKLVENVEHILEDFGMKGEIMREAHSFEKDELTILEKLAIGGKHIDQLFEETEFDIPRLSELLIFLTLKKAVIQQNEKWVIA